MLENKVTTTVQRLICVQTTNLKMTNADIFNEIHFQRSVGGLLSYYGGS